ncbi:MAG: class I SAM-dependent methyltransferase [bacterium]
MRKLYEKFGREQSRRFVEDLREAIRPWLERSFGYHSVQLEGESLGHSLLELSPISHRVLMAKGGQVEVVGDGRALPFDSRSIDLVILPYTLEVSGDPHSVLREVERVLLPEGRLLIVGRDPWALLEMGRLFRADGTAVYSQRRVRDWLRVLGLEAGRSTLIPMISFNWPTFFERWPKADTMFRLLSANLRGSYVLLASKREEGMKPLVSPWKLRPRLVSGGLVEPAARGFKKCQ